MALAPPAVRPESRKDNVPSLPAEARGRKVPQTTRWFCLCPKHERKRRKRQSCTWVPGQTASHLVGNRPCLGPQAKTQTTVQFRKGGTSPRPLCTESRKGRSRPLPGQSPRIGWNNGRPNLPKPSSLRQRLVLSIALSLFLSPSRDIRMRLISHGLIV